MKNQEKKEYVAPQMIVEEYGYQGAILFDSSCEGELATCLDDKDDD
ncbi:hypothetical protein [Fibrobacter succinogenes]|nr:hypothetical protein [Fibrobacter succinogenes]